MDRIFDEDLNRPEEPLEGDNFPERFPLLHETFERCIDSGDREAETFDALFTVCDVMCDSGMCIPRAWGYKRGNGAKSDKGNPWYEEVLGHSESEILAFGNYLNAGLNEIIAKEEEGEFPND